MQHCDQTCSHCAREFFKWWKTWTKKMMLPQDGATTTFAEAAATSVGATNRHDREGN